MRKHRNPSHGRGHLAGGAGVHVGCGESSFIKDVHRGCGGGSTVPFWTSAFSFLNARLATSRDSRSHRSTRGWTSFWVCGRRERPGSAQGNPDARVDPFDLILQARPPRGIVDPLEGARVVHRYRLPVPCRVAEGVCRNLVEAVGEEVGPGPRRGQQQHRGCNHHQILHRKNPPLEM